MQAQSVYFMAQASQPVVHTPITYLRHSLCHSPGRIKEEVVLAYLTFLVHVLEHESALRCEVVNYDTSGYVGGSVYEY